MRRMLPMWLLLALTCPVSAAEAPSTRSDSSVPLPLTEVLYGGETGAKAREQGDRIRMLVWLQSLDLDVQGLEALGTAATTVQDLAHALDAEITAAGAQEHAQIQESYAQLERALLSGSPTERELADLAIQIQEARRGLVDPRILKARFADAVLEQAALLLAAWGPVQRARVGDVLFLLRPTVGEGTAPGALEHLLGPAWRIEEYSTLRRSASPVELDHLNIGGLWSLDAGSTQRSQQILADQQLVLLALALSHPALVEACQALSAPPEEGAPG